MPTSAPADHPHAATLDRLPLAFVPNAGQAPDAVLFESRQPAANLALTSQGVTLSRPD